MSEALDPAPAYLLLITGLIVIGLAVGYTMGDTIGVIGGAILTGLLGFLSGLYTSREETDIVGSLAITGGFTALIAWFFPLSITWGIAVFLLGFILGMRTERR